ncbi:MAG: GEVED domain-containing protein, partial [Flavipsychrobacter sp.]
VDVDHYSPCSGVPSISGITPAGPVSVCPPSYVTLTGSLPLATGYAYQWQKSTDSGTTWTNIANDTNASATMYVLSSTAYRLKVKCVNSGLTDSSAPVYVHTAVPVLYAKGLPVVEDFENWKDRCDSKDMPDTNWVISPVTGNNAWRRDDQGLSDGGWSSDSGSYTPVAAHGSHSARFHSYDAGTQAKGTMDMYLDCSSVSGVKQLRLKYINQDGNDSMAIYLSTDSGATFNYLGHCLNDYGWASHYYTINSNSPKTIIRFAAVSDSGVVSNDIGLDYVQVVPPCSGKPVAGTIDSVYPCSGSDFNLTLSGTSEVAGLKYIWQQSADGVSWTSIAPYDTTEIALANITTATYFRAIVKCSVSGLSDTSDVQLIEAKPHYLCYCTPTAVAPSVDSVNIGNVTVRTIPGARSVLNNGIATPVTNNSTAVHSYSNFDTLTPAVLYLDSLYRLSVSEITQYGSFPTGSGYTVSAFIDYNHNEVFDAAELVYRINTSVAGGVTFSDTIRIPNTPSADTGITGMRVILSPTVVSTSGSDVICGDSVILGEYEDYLVNIKFPPCSGYADAGKIQTADSAACLGYTFIMADTTHEHYRSGISWSWQTSADSFVWNDISGTADRDTLSQVFTARVWYRVRMVCAYSHDTSYSVPLYINIKPAYKCYCLSQAAGGNMDTSDIGGVAIGPFVYTKGGGHLNNSKAIYAHEDFTNHIIDLYVDTTYAIDVYYIMHHNFNANAKVTLFLDYDNNYKYDIPTELLWTAYTTPTSWYLTHNITIPELVVSDVPTGMRIVVNNNTGASTASDDGCGTYTSGETMDFVVRFNRAWTAGVGNISNLQDMVVYPNPTDGAFYVQFNAQSTINDLVLSVTNMTGQQVVFKNYRIIKGAFKADINLSSMSKGIYFLNLVADGQKIIRKIVVK